MIHKFVMDSSEGDPTSFNLFNFFSQQWKNEFLMWNARKYGDTDSVNFAPEEIWVPDIALYNK